MKIAKVIVDISHEKLDRPFDYIIPDSMIDDIAVGSSVEIPFGKGNRLIDGYVIDITNKSDYDISKLKELAGVKERGVNAQGQLINLAHWIKENYGATMNKALKTVLPVKEKVNRVVKQSVKLNLSQEEVDEKIEQYKKKNAKARVRLLVELKEENVLSKNLVTDKLNISSSTLKTMEELGDIIIEKETSYRNPIDIKVDGEYNITLNEQQQKVSDDIKKGMNFEKNGKVDVHLLHGITGSGKTEVYMDLIDYAIKNGKQAIVLIPEIALTYQTVMRFTKRFGDRISIINSKLSKGERFDQFERAKEGLVDIMIGPRSALFTPFKNLGLIIIDEEHESSYKSESVPKYDAIEVASKRAFDNGATLVLGSATPSIESYYRANKGFYKLHKLTYREKGALPKVNVVDMKEEAKEGNKSMFSNKLKELINDRLQKKEQTMLFINRRGLAGFVSCGDCGKALRCPHCDVSLKLHKGKLMKCHYCGFEMKQPDVCPECGSKYLGQFGTGTQRIEEDLKEVFPTARILRMDADTTSSKSGHQEILSAFANKEADILVGTQMIVKGHDFENVTLVGVLAADMSLNEQDYKASERTFQLICQGAGRAGRGDRPGDVVIQTYDPDNYSIKCASDQDYEEFYKQEIAYRDLLSYPPVTNMLCILLQDKDEYKLNYATGFVENIVKKIKAEKYKDIMVIGPTSPAIARINDVLRNVIYIKSNNRNELINIKNYIESLANSPKMQNVSIQFDFKA